MRRMGAVWVLAALAAAGPLAAQEGAGRRGDLVAMAGVLGESQALRELCEGRQDQYWRSRMMRLLALEEAEGGAGAALTAAFNSAYAEAREAYAACGPASRRAELMAAERGERLAVSLAGPPPARGAEEPIAQGLGER